MRTGLTVLAVFLVAVLTAALLAPYFVNWSAQRSTVEAQLSHVLGERVRVQGAIDLKLLPSPYMTLGQVEVADAQSGEVIFSCDQMELSLGLTSLARGQFRFTQVSLARPILDLPRNPAGEYRLPNINLTSRSSSIAFDRVIVRDGRVRATRADGVADLDVAGIDLDAEADSLLGPFKGSGSAPGPGQTKLAFSFATGVVEGAGLRFKAAIDGGAGTLRSEFDGALTLAGSMLTSDVASLGYSGGVTFSGSIAGVSAPMPWRASGILKADMRGAAFDDLEVRLGQEDRALTTNGAAQAIFGAKPQININLAAKQLNFDSLLRTEGEDSATPIQAYQALGAALAGFDIGRGSPLAVSFDLSTPAAILAGDTIADVALSIASTPDAPVAGKFEASLPGRSHILASGTIELGAAPGFKGRVDANIGDASRLRDWLTRGAPELEARLSAIGDVLPYRSASAMGDVDVSTAGFAARNLSLVLERTTFTGALAMTRAVGTESGRLFMDLQTEALDLDSLPNVGASGNFLRDIDLSLALDAHAIRIARVGEGQVDGGSLKLALTKQGDDIRLERLSIADLGGATVDANGAIEGKTRWFSAKIDAARLRDFALLVKRVAPGWISDTLVDRSGALSPAKLVFSVQSPRPNDAAGAADSLTVQGSVGTTRVEGKLARADSGGALNATLSLDSPDVAPLLRQLGAPAQSLSGSGRGHFDASIRGRWGEGLDADIAASLAGADFVWRGKVLQKAGDADDAQATGAGSLKTGNATPLLAVLGVAPPDSAVAAPIDLSSDVTWRGDRLVFSRLQGALGRAHLSGDLNFWPTLAQPSAAVPADPDVALAEAVAGDSAAASISQLEGTLSVDRLPLSALAGLALGAPQPVKPGAVWSDGKFSPGLVNPPSANIALSIAALDVTDSLLAHDARVQLKLGRGLVGLDDFSMSLADGMATGHATLRRDGPNASLSGQVSIEPIALDRPNLAARISGAMDFAGTGQSANALVAGLAGTGQIRVADARIPRLDQDALGRIIDKAQSSDYAIDQTNVSHALDQELGKQALRIADVDVPASLTAGVIRVGPFEARDSRNDASLQASFDMRSLVLEIRATLSELQIPKYWSGSAPAISVVLKGPLDSAVREVDSSLFVAGLAAQAIARETERIAALESDIRERAFFNRRLKAGQFMRRRELELAAYAIEQTRLKSEDARGRVEAEALMADEERRRAAAPEPLPTAPDPSQPSPPAPRSQNASPPTDPTQSGLY